MISVTRLPEPSILTQKKEKWLAAFLKKRELKPGTRPDSRQYGHQEIRETLEAMSFHKCFYCEHRLVETKGEVDHYVEVAEKSEWAFEWNNLYLSCPACNRGKLFNTAIPASDCLDPCDITKIPSEYLAFDDEYIIPKLNSARGKKTIQKYKLDRLELNYLRSKQLQRFERFLRKLRERQNCEGRKKLTLAEKEVILRFKEPHHAFSLMFEVYLSRIEF